MADSALRAELMAVPGVASAEVDAGESDAPAGVRVRLSPDADARRVGVEVQRVLAAHGMRSRFSEPASPESAPPPEPTDDAPSDVGEIPPPPATAPPDLDSPPVEEPPATVVPMAAVPSPPDAPPPVRVIPGGLQSVAVEERADGLGVVVKLDDGRVGTHGLEADDDAELDAAVIAAVAGAVDLSVATLATEWMEVDGGSIVTVVLRLPDGALVAGAGVVRVGRAYAVGMAARAALAN